MAQHATVHFFEDSHYVEFYHKDSSHGANHHENKDEDGACQLCLFVKSFHDVMMSMPPAILVASFQRDFTSILIQDTKQQAYSPIYLARAPPTFLS